jgi:high-affinity iron transporter
LDDADALLLVVLLLSVLARNGPSTGDNSSVRRIHGGWVLALPLGLATSIVFYGTRPIPGAARDALQAGLSLLTGGGLLYLGRAFFARDASTESRPLRHVLAGAGAALFAVTFAAAYRDTFVGVSLFRSLVACGVGALPVVAGVSVGAAALGLLAAAYAPATRLLPPRASAWVSVGLLCALDVLFLGRAVVAVHSLVTA